ncbi:fimbrial protein [Lelliottia amnigena]|jgi:type 1 fimbria pilin
MKRSFCTGVSLCALSLVLMAGINVDEAQALDNNLHFSGTLVSEPCNLDPQTSDITVDFSSVVEKYLYQNTRTLGVPLVVNLTDCDISLGNKVTMIFKGTESSVLPGLLATTGSAKGIAIGMETPDGTKLPFNQPTPEYAIATGSNQLTLKAYVQGEPVAIAQQNITPGDISATATFELAYP